MKKIVFIINLLSILSLPLLSQNSIKKSRNTCYVSGRYLYSPLNEKIIIRGVNVMSVVVDPTGEKTLPEIAKTGSNAVRLMWMLWGGGSEKLDTLLYNCIKNKMIPILELHDATGKWSDALNKLTLFWTDPKMVRIIKKYEKYLLLNIANEPGTDTVSHENFRNTYKSIIYKMRLAGIDVPIMIDAANYGRNEDYLLKNAQYLLKHDPKQNLIFSWHIWDSGISEKRISNAFDKAEKLNINLLVGEFAPLEVKCKCCIPYKFILKKCFQKQIGWLAWSWGVGNSDCRAMDMTETLEFNSLTGWGLEVAITDVYSIKNTSIKPKIIH